jgi:hypothetical protein
MTLTDDEKAGWAHDQPEAALAITPYFLNLIDRSEGTERRARRMISICAATARRSGGRGRARRR